MNPTPQILKDCIHKAELIMQNEVKANIRYKDLQRKGKSFTVSEYAATVSNIKDHLKEFNTLYLKIADLYPEWIKEIPKVHLPIFRR